MISVCLRPVMATEEDLVSKKKKDIDLISVHFAKYRLYLNFNVE